MRPGEPGLPSRHVSALALVGLMGSGKSTVGRSVAERSGRRFVDVDVAIEHRTGRNVRELWAAGGEAAYRRLESEECLAALGDDSVVLATPGGAVLDPQVRGALLRCAVVWLRAEPAVLAGRVTVGDHRPLLDEDPEGTLATMASDRAALYAAVADRTIDTDGLTPDAVADEVLRWMQEGRRSPRGRI